ncbi:DNA mismatch repair protein MSH6, putative [Trypanosoma equiperdum]|uniref:DNA mismatch repair protein MSH6, putative n=1 Tax=Trypanosoma equiperdum TaxID=5694 RepID=A0A1G4IKU7_TRYEQ|nr:DNA mismatch repair protein MSH6, putative [Trypanosoma equiperdum]
MPEVSLECEDICPENVSYPFLRGIDPKRPPSSITIPPRDLEAMAAMERQYWEVKSKHYDVVIFFKKGKFYELYDQDAAMAHREFGLKLVVDTTNRGKMRLAGVPEQTFSEWARLFVFRGYKVGRVEQMKEEGESSKNARPKVVPRELVEILTPGTITDPMMISGYGAVFVLALYPMGSGSVDGMAVDLSRRVVFHCPCGTNGKESAAGFVEEVLNEVSALLQQIRPREIIIPRGAVDAPGEEPKGSFGRRLFEWVEGEGFQVELVEEVGTSLRKLPLEERSLKEAGRFLAQYFRSLKLSNVDSILLEARPYNFHLLKQQVTSGVPSNDRSRCSDSTLLWYERREDPGLVLDAATVSNLELVGNLRDDSERGSLFNLINRCCTNGGKRLFRSWILRPSASPRVINARQEAVRFIIENNLNDLWAKTEESADVTTPICTPNSSTRTSEGPTQEFTQASGTQCGSKRGRTTNTFESRFTNLFATDFERNLSRLADLKGDSQQIAFVDPLVQYKKHLQLIISTVVAFEEMLDWSNNVQKECAPPLLQELWGTMGAVAPAVASIKACFDRKAAEVSGVIVPSQGACPAYDEATECLDIIEKKLDEVLRELRDNIFNGAAITYSHIGRENFLVEVPLMEAPKRCPPGFIERSRTSACVRYTVAGLEPLVEEHKRAKTKKADALLLVVRNIASHIFNYFPVLYEATAALCYFDCLLSLASLHTSGVATCYPVVQECDAGAYLLAEELRHPFLKSDSVPNTVNLDATHGRILVLTGPNMAGKSTLMRTVAVNVIIAQMGGPVFATSMRLAPVTRVFTRIGARDATHKGQSTLYVELSETAEIVRFAGPWSLCLVDELGRGTSTHDGYTIAHAMLAAMKKRHPVPPLLLFSTHYHALAQEEHKSMQKSTSSAASETGGVQLGYMDFAVSAASDSNIPTITFLYRLVPGICARSYGVEVALLAGISPGVVNTARVKSLELAKWYERQRDLGTVRGFITPSGTQFSHR